MSKIHVVPSQSVRGTIKCAFNKMKVNDDVIWLPIDLSISYIPKDFSDKELCFALASCDGLDRYDMMKKFLSTDFSSYDKVVVWHGWSARDLLLLYLMSVLVDGNLYCIDIRESSEFMNVHLDRSPSKLFLDMDYVSPYDVSIMFAHEKHLSREAIQHYREEWCRWANTNTSFRFSNVHTGIIEEYPECFMDESIIEYAESGLKYGRILGNVMFKYDYLFIPDSIISRRIIKLLIKSKKIKYLCI